MLVTVLQNRQFQSISIINRLQAYVDQIYNEKMRLMDYIFQLQNGGQDFNIAEKTYELYFLEYLDKNNLRPKGELMHISKDNARKASEYAMEQIKNNPAAADISAFLLNNQLNTAKERETRLSMEEKYASAKLTAEQQVLQNTEQALQKALQDCAPKYAGLA